MGCTCRLLPGAVVLLLKMSFHTVARRHHTAAEALLIIAYLSVSPLRAYLRISFRVCSGVDRPAPVMDRERAIKAACRSGISVSRAPLRAFRASPSDSGKSERSLDPWASVKSPIDWRRDLSCERVRVVIIIKPSKVSHTI